MRDEQRQLGLSMEHRLATLERIHRKWDAEGQPPDRAA
jgi:hypothetical protein